MPIFRQRKVLFRQAALEHVTILKQIDSILKRKSDHSIADEFFHDILDEHFSEDEVQRQFETAMNWGRYAEIFDYDRERGGWCRPKPRQRRPMPRLHLRRDSEPRLRSETPEHKFRFERRIA